MKTIVIETRGGPRVVDIVAECDTLAIHRAHDGGRSWRLSWSAPEIAYPWVLSHKGTGHAVGHFRTLKAARIAMRVAAGWDWSLLGATVRGIETEAKALREAHAALLKQLGSDMHGGGDAR